MARGAKNFKVSENVQEAGLILGALGVIGFIGIIWLLVYGNLSGNLGFGQDTLSFVNETMTLVSSGNTPAGASGRVNGLISNSSTTLIIINESTGVVIDEGNYTVSLVTISATSGSGQFNNSVVNVSYSVAFDSPGLVNTENVIFNVTGGFNTFFTFSNTFFTIAAIVLLIFMFLGLLAIVVMIMNMQKGGRGGFAE